MRAIILVLVLLAGLAEARNGQRLFREMARTAVGGGVAAKTATFLWHFDEPANSTNVTDSGILGLSMIVSNNANTVSTPAKFGNALSFGVPNDKNHVLIPYNSAYQFGTNDWSIDMWITITNAADTLDNSTITAFGGQRPDNKWPFLNIAKVNYEPRWFFRISQNGVDYTQIVTANMGPSCSNKWMHIAVFRYTNYVHIATNGVIGWRSSASGWNFSSAETVGLSLGENKPYAGGFRGAWDEVRLCIGASMPYRGIDFTPPSTPYTGTE